MIYLNPVMKLSLVSCLALAVVMSVCVTILTNSACTLVKLVVMPVTFITLAILLVYPIVSILI